MVWLAHQGFLKRRLNPSASDDGHYRDWKEQWRLEKSPRKQGDRANPSEYAVIVIKLSTDNADIFIESDEAEDYGRLTITISTESCYLDLLMPAKRGLRERPFVFPLILL